MFSNDYKVNLNVLSINKTLRFLDLNLKLTM